MGEPMYWEQYSLLDEERMRPSHWLGSMLWVSFSTLTPLVGWEEEYLSCTT